MRLTTRTWPKASLSLTVIVAVTFLPLRAALLIVRHIAAAAFRVPPGRILSVADRPAASAAPVLVSRIVPRTPVIRTVPLTETTTAPMAGAVTFVASESVDVRTFWRPERETVVVVTALTDGQAARRRSRRHGGR